MNTIDEITAIKTLIKQAVDHNFTNKTANDALAAVVDPFMMMRVIEVRFANPDWNYRTNINGTKRSICDYYNTKVDVGRYPEENMQAPIAIAFIDQDETTVVKYETTVVKYESFIGTFMENATKNDLYLKNDEDLVYFLPANWVNEFIEHDDETEQRETYCYAPLNYDNSEFNTLWIPLNELADMRIIDENKAKELAPNLFKLFDEINKE